MADGPDLTHADPAILRGRAAVRGTRISLPGIALLALAGACASAGGRPEAAARATEQEVLMMIIAQHGRGAVLMDRTYGHGCMERLSRYCDNSSAPRELWQAYVQASSRPMPLRDLLPGDGGFTFESDVGDESALSCERRSRKLQLSRVGLSRDGQWGVVSYYVSMPTSPPMCTTGAGATVVVRRERDGTWVIDRPLSTVIS